MSMNAGDHEAPHRNHGLFSDHYLNTHVPAHRDWAAQVEATVVADGAVE